MKVQVVVFVAACVLCTLPGTSAASLKKRTSYIADLLEELETVVKKAEAVMETAIESVNETIIEVEKAALSSVNTVIVNAIESVQTEVTEVIGNNTLTDYISCVNVSNTMTDLGEDIVEAGNTCVEQVISPITSVVDDILTIQKQMIGLLESAEEVYDECGDLNVICQLVSLPPVLLQALEDAAVDATKATTLVAELTEIDPSVLVDEVGTCIAEETVTVVSEVVVELAEAVVSCFYSVTNTTSST